MSESLLVLAVYLVIAMITMMIGAWAAFGPIHDEPGGDPLEW